MTDSIQALNFLEILAMTREPMLIANIIIVTQSAIVDISMFVLLA